MSETTSEEHTRSTSGTDHERDLKNFPLLANSRTARVLLQSSPAFRLLMFGSSISMLGTRISTVAFPMLVLHLNKSPLVTGLVAFAAIAPSMLVYVPAGVLVDYWNPRRVMLVSELFRGLTIASVVIALAIYRTHVYLWFLILAMVAEEILEIFATLADRRYLSRVMERDKIDSQQASIEVRTHAVVLAGRPVGPFLFSIQPFYPFLADAASFIASVGSLLLIRRDDEQSHKAQRLVLREVLNDIGHGFEWLKRDRRAWLTVVLMAATSLVAQALILMFLVEAHSKQFSTLAIGVVLAASGVGGAVGSFCSRIVPTDLRSFWLPIQMAVWSVALACLALAGGQSAYWSAIAMFMLGLTGAIGNVEFGTYLVRTVDDDKIAKVTGIGQVLFIGAYALGPVFGGFAIQHWRIQGAIFLLFCIVTTLGFLSLCLPGAPQQMVRMFEVFKQVVAGDVNAPGANSKPLSGAAANSCGAGPEQHRQGGYKVVMSRETISRRTENSRLVSSINRYVLTCGDTES